MSRGDCRNSGAFGWSSRLALVAGCVAGGLAMLTACGPRQHLAFLHLVAQPRSARHQLAGDPE